MTRFPETAGDGACLRLGGKAALAIVLLGTALLAGSPPAGQAPAGAPQELHFEGSWSASGARQVLEMGPGRRAFTLYLSGSVILDIHEGMSRGFRSETIGFYDGRKLAVGESVWTDEHGDQVFSDFEAKSIVTGQHVTGVITGGTGRYAGMTGRYEFTWQYVLDSPEGATQGRAVGLKGYVRREPAASTPLPGKVPR